jgi:competence protein ComFC
LNPLLSAVLDLVYPRTCAACGRPVLEPESHICWDCLTRIPLIIDPFCARCGDPVDGMVEHDYVCSWCREARPHFAQARSAARYRGPLRPALHAFKYEQVTALGADLVTLLQACVSTHFAAVAFDAVTFVPLYPTRERDRTYNQAHLLAAGLGDRLDIPLLTRGLRRVRPTPSQTNFNAIERRANVKGAFEALEPRWLEGRCLLLVDDVMTTGATLNECAGVLRDAGAAAVYVATVGRG